MIRVCVWCFMMLLPVLAVSAPARAADEKPESRTAGEPESRTAGEPESRTAGEPEIRKVNDDAAARSGATTQSADDKAAGEKSNDGGNSNDDTAKPNDDAPSSQNTGKADPTQPSDALKDVLTPRQDGGANAPRAAAQPKLPAIQLRARVLVKGRSAAALIQVGESLHRVYPGADLTVSTASGAVHLRVEQLDADGVRIALPQFDQTLELR